MAAIGLAWAAQAFAHTAEPTRAQWATKLAWPARLCPLQSPRPGSAGVQVQPIDAQRRWIVVDCATWAYQGTQLVYLQTQQRTTLLQFTQFDAENPGKPRRYQSTLVTGSIAFDPVHGQLQVLRLCRGIGDCGQHLVYDAGSAPPRLQALRLRECPDTPDPTLPPTHWPQRSF